MKKSSFTTIVLLSLTPIAQANKVKTLSVSAPDGYHKDAVVKVYSTNGEKWTSVDNTHESLFAVNLNAKCKYEGKGNKAYKGNFWVSGFERVGTLAPSNKLIPHSKKASSKFRYQGDTNLNIVKACNTELTKRLSENADLTKYHVLAKGFTIDYPAAFNASYSLLCKPTGIGFSDSRTKSTKINAKIQCQGSDLAKEKIPKPKPVPIKKVKLAKLIKKIEFGPNMKHIVGKCPAQVEYNGSITANRFGMVEYQYVSHDGRKSPKFKLKFDKAGTKKLRVWKRTINKESDVKTIRASSSNKRKFDYAGWYRVDILNQEGVNSVKKGYTLTCQDKPMQIKK